MDRNSPVNDDGCGQDNCLVDDVEGEVGRQLGEELREAKLIVYGDGERSRNAFAEVVAVEEVGEDGAEYASQYGEGENGEADF